MIAANGCDSIITTNTTLVSTYNITQNETSCDPLAVGISIDTFMSALGCDSIVTVNTSLLVASFNTLQLHKCRVVIQAR
ncbi:MAG: hypothetical protein R2753_17190 [Chitinophagales bacterium]